MCSSDLPTINLDNFKDIQEMSYKNDDLVIVFDTLASSTDAYNEWSKTPNMAIIVSHVWLLTDGKFSTFAITDISEPSTESMTLQVKRIGIEDVISEYTVEITKLVSCT